MTTAFAIDSQYGQRSAPKMHYQGERGYMEMLSDILHFGSEVPDRTGVGRRKLFGVTQRYDLRKGFPHPTIRSTPLRIAFHEFWAFLNGRVDIDSYLQNHGISIWAGNTTREFLDGRGLHHLPVGHMGKAYGFQYRNFNGSYDENFMPQGGVDQIKNKYNELRSDPFSSRLVTTIWNPEQESEMALPPCWWNNQFVTTLDADGNKVLNLQVTGRSNDCLFGTPFNIQEFALYLMAMAEATNMIAGELMTMQVDAHIYGKLGDVEKESADNNPASQIKYVVETLGRDINESPVTLSFKKPLTCFDDLVGLEFEDLILTGLEINKTKYVEKRPQMAV
jgi:thymidylate synthase